MRHEQPGHLRRGRRGRGQGLRHGPVDATTWKRRSFPTRPPYGSAKDPSTSPGWSRRTSSAATCRSAIGIRWTAASSSTCGILRSWPRSRFRGAPHPAAATSHPPGRAAARIAEILVLCRSASAPTTPCASCCRRVQSPKHLRRHVGAFRIAPRMMPTRHSGSAVIEGRELRDPAPNPGQQTHACHAAHRIPEARLSLCKNFSDERLRELGEAPARSRPAMKPSRTRATKPRTSLWC